MKNYCYLLFLPVLMFASCVQDTEDLRIYYFPQDEYAVLEQTLNIPNQRVEFRQDFPSFVGSFRNVNSNKALLGRVLFYDKELSKTREVSCASCHHQENGFADRVAFSTGINGQKTVRNSLALGVNVTQYYGSPSVRLFWDERASGVPHQSTETIQNPIEMGMGMEELTDRLATVDYYPILFKKAYGDTEITEDRITEALDNFVNSIGSFESKFDKEITRHFGNMNPDFAGFTERENRGKALFASHCQSCHGNTIFAPFGTANNGLDLDYEDLGVYAITGHDEDVGKFKIPLLRNIALTAPYMHDGRFSNLTEVVDHYRTGLQTHDNLDLRLRDTHGNPLKNHFSEQDRDDLVVFLHTLTDDHLAQIEYLSDPFK